jgi:hypothetical protein
VRGKEPRIPQLSWPSSDRHRRQVGVRGMRSISGGSPYTLPYTQHALPSPGLMIAFHICLVGCESRYTQSLRLPRCCCCCCCWPLRGCRRCAHSRWRLRYCRQLRLHNQ